MTLRPNSGTVDPGLELLWKRTLADWNNAAAHTAFLEYARESAQLVQAATYYRGMTGDHDRGELAKKHLGAVTLLALSTLEASRPTVGGAAPSHASWLLIAFFVAATIGLILYTLHP